jgi:hypothetical protein
MWTARSRSLRRFIPGHHVRGGGWLPSPLLLFWGHRCRGHGNASPGYPAPWPPRWPGPPARLAQAAVKLPRFAARKNKAEVRPLRQSLRSPESTPPEARSAPRHPPAPARRRGEKRRGGDDDAGGGRDGVPARPLGCGLAAGEAGGGAGGSGTAIAAKEAICPPANRHVAHPDLLHQRIDSRPGERPGCCARLCTETQRKEGY